MRLLLTLIFPWLAFFTIKRPVDSVTLLILQITLVDWLPAVIWATYVLSQYNTYKKIKATIAQKIEDKSICLA